LIVLVDFTYIAKTFIISRRRVGHQGHCCSSNLVPCHLLSSDCNDRTVGYNSYLISGIISVVTDLPILIVGFQCYNGWARLSVIVVAMVAVEYWNFRPWEHSSPGTKVPQGRTIVPWNIRPLELSFLGTKIPCHIHFHQCTYWHIRKSC